MRVRTGLLGLLVAAGMASCGSDDEGEPAKADTTKEQPAATQAPEEFSAEDGGPGPNQATSDAPSQTEGSKALRAYLRSEGKAKGASWADDIDEDETTLAQEGRAASITVNGRPTETELRDACETAKAYETSPAFVTVSNWDGAVNADC